MGVTGTKMSRENRKSEHLRLALQSVRAGEPSAFDDLTLVHRSLPEIDLAEVNPETRLGPVELKTPLLINAMTGGSLPAQEVNQALAVIARETGFSLAVGSQKAALDNPQLAPTYQVVRQVNPRGVIIANLSAAATVEEAERAVAMIGADLLQLHLNVPQELLMPEGDRSFRGMLDQVACLAARVPVPVIVKEVGFGMCAETYRQLEAAGVFLVDVGGRGGANFVRIENQRRPLREYAYLGDWGQPTAVSLLESLDFQERLRFIASGGIRNCLDMVKCFILGACAVGVASPVLQLYQESGIDGAIAVLNSWREQLRTLMGMLGARTLGELRSLPVVITGRTKDWCLARGIAVGDLGRRA